MLDVTQVPSDEDIVGSSETNGMHERVVICPSDGRFVPLPPQIFTTEGEWVEEGQTLAEVSIGDARVPVISSFTGWMMGMLALEGQPVYAGQALFWLWPC
jgi:biotin carboxyl carrier protein